MIIMKLVFSLLKSAREKELQKSIIIIFKKWNKVLIVKYWLAMI